MFSLIAHLIAYRRQIAAARAATPLTAVAAARTVANDRIAVRHRIRAA